MRLYMKQKVFALKDRFTIKNEAEEDVYTVEGKFISLGKKLHILDTNGEEVAFVKQELLTFMPKFTVLQNGEEVAQIQKKMSFLKPKYVVTGLDWTIEGDVFGHDYTIFSGENAIVSIHKKWMSWGDTFELDLADAADVPLTVAVVLAIDAVMDAAASAAASSSST